MSTIVDKATHIVNKKNIYVILSLLAIVLSGFGIHYLYKDYLTRSVVTKFMTSLKELKPEWFEDLKGYELVTFKRELSDTYKKFTIDQLNYTLSLSSDQIKKSLSDILSKR